MKTMTRVSAAESPVVAFRDREGSSGEECVYEGVRLDGPKEKLIPLVDNILFYCRVARLRTRPTGIAEAEGVRQNRLEQLRASGLPWPHAESHDSSHADGSLHRTGEPGLGLKLPLAFSNGGLPA